MAKRVTCREPPDLLPLKRTYPACAVIAINHETGLFSRTEKFLLLYREKITESRQLFLLQLIDGPANVISAKWLKFK